MSISKAVADRLDRVLRKLEGAFGITVGAPGMTVTPVDPGYMTIGTYPVTIASGAAVSSAIVMPSPAPRGWAVEFENAWTAANVGFEGSDDGSNWVPIKKDSGGTRVMITTIATNAVACHIAPAEAWVLGSYAQIRLASLDTSDSTAENQAGARALKVKAFS